MTEWDKMQAHQIYNDFDADLFNRRVVAKKLFREFNRTEEDNVGFPVRIVMGHEHV